MYGYKYPAKDAFESTPTDPGVKRLRILNRRSIPNKKERTYSRGS